MTLWILQGLSASYWMLAYQYADDDTGLAVRLARACLERGACKSAGTPTSGLGLSHGATWIRLIGYSLTTDGGLRTLQLIVVASLVAAMVVSAIAVWKALSWRAGIFASLFVLPATMATLRFDDLTNGVLLPLPLAVYWACTLWAVQSGRLTAALGASVSMAAAMSPSLSSILLAPLHLALVALVARKPVAALLLAPLAIAATFAIESAAAAAQLARLLVGPSLVAFGLFLVAGIAAVVVPAARTTVGRIAAAAQRCRRRFRAMPAPVRVRVAMKLAATYLIAAGWIGSMAGGLRIPDAHFFATAVFPLVFLGADATPSMSGGAAASVMAVLVLALGGLVYAPLAVAVGSVLCVIMAGVLAFLVIARRLRSGGTIASDLEAPASAQAAVAGALLVCLMCTPDALIYPRTRQVWPVATAEKMVRRLYASGLTFPELMSALQGQAPYTLQSMIASLDPEFWIDQPIAADGAMPSLLTMIVDPAVAADARDVVMRLDTAARQTAIAIRSASVLDRARLRTCYARSCDAPMDPERCMTRDPHGRVRHDRPYFPVVLEAPTSGALLSSQPAGTTYCVRFFTPLRMPGTGEPHWLRVSQPWPLHVRIRDVTGVAYDGMLPGPEVRLSNDERATGSVEVEVSADGIGPQSDWLEQPPLIEVNAANEHLLDLYRSGRVTLR